MKECQCFSPKSSPESVYYQKSSEKNYSRNKSAASHQIAIIIEG